MDLKRATGGRRWLKLLGLALLAWLLARQDLPALAAALRGTRLDLFGAALLLFFPLVGLRAWRWRALVADAAGPRLDGGAAFREYAATVFLGALTPGRVGELYRLRCVTRRGASLGGAAAPALLDRACDIAFLAGLGALALVVHAGGIGLRLQPVLLAALALGAGLAAGLAFRKRAAGLFQALARRFLKTAHAERLERELGNLLAAVRGVPPRTWLASAAATAAAWAVFFTQRYMLARALDLDVGIVPLCTAMVAVALLVLLPVSILNIGTRDAALVLLLGAEGVGSEQALAFSSLILLTLLANWGISCLFFLTVRLD